MSFLTEVALLAGAGLVAGVVNVLAGGGSFLTLPILLFLGLPATVAKATNRVGVLAQNISGVWGYHRHGALDWGYALRASVPAVVGAGVGTWAALRVPDFAFTRLLSMAMLAVTLWSLWSNRPRAQGSAPRRALASSSWQLTAGFFGVGVYGGFIQAGVGFFILALTTAAGLPLIRGNAVKVLSVLLITVLSLAIFGGAGAIDWPRGLALAAGNFVGGLAGVRLAVLKGQRWLEQLVTATVILFAILLWLS
ncbi:MAG: sulfite exporter TauE/SafE family protein [Acidobacteria bacterium]|nr:sulfite exporter TauE/SafE family protein [Acidobacteriota bacterium]